MRREIFMGVYRVASSWWARLWGLLGRGDHLDRVMLVGCHAIHTCFMRYPIDVAIVDADGMVVLSRRAVPPWKTVSDARGVKVLERPSYDSPWIEVGEELSFEWEKGRSNGSNVEVWVVEPGEGSRYKVWGEGAGSFWI